jgi:signal transduction histidine kinase
MEGLIRSFEWEKTPLGSVETWSPALRTMVRFLQANRFPLLLWWGPDYISIYNDPYRPVLGKKHPWALGLPVRECWSEIWHILQPLIDRPFHGGPATWNDDIALEINRNGFVEETHFTIAYSPVPDETVPTGIGGVLATVHEITDKVIGERRVVALRDLGARVGEARTVERACELAAQTLSAHEKDVPFVLLYLTDADGSVARLAASSGVAPGSGISPTTIDPGAADGTGWPIAAAMRSETLQVVTSLQERFGSVPGGPWSDPPDTAVIVPIPSNKPHEPLGAIVAGISARLKFDEYYKDFLELVRTQIASAIGQARAYEDERKRAEALAEIDRAKTLFFSNVSHELRTPLTLMLGPIEDLLAEANGSLTDGQRHGVEILHRNAGRLLKLVNALLDFARIEAGRAQASYRPTDVTALTRELASAFRSAIEHAGIRFEVACEPVAEPVFLDRDMWEKIVLNLLSNALKFTFDGVIRLELRAADGVVELAVRDTGTGIPDHERPRIFERFHRVEGARSRTHEGTGIGLALTNELVRLHGGTIDVDSQVGEGSRFVVRIPTGRAHLPGDRIIDAAPLAAATTIGSAPFVNEAAQWMPEPLADGGGPSGAADPRAAGERILVADDNADMRDYLSQVLRDWTVMAAADGRAALDIARATVPHLIVSDVMMPGLDGFALLRELRGDPRTAGIPVLMLSARAGEEARVSGLDAGADDYIIKPFSARELRARVASLLNLSRARRDAELQRAAAEAASRTKDDFLAMLGHELRNPLAPILTALQLMSLRGDASVLKERTVIDRQVRHLVRLVDDLLDVSRIARGKIELRQQPSELAEVVAAAVESTSPLLEERRHELMVDVPPGLAVKADVTRLTQVVANLLTNAAKYTEPRGRIRVKARTDGDRIELRVKDSGIGIGREMLDRVFDMFTQSRQALDRAHGGLGLGLTIVKSLVELHGGSIQALSDGPGKGSEFVLRLPAAGPALSPAQGVEPPAGAAAAVPRTGRRILVVDDNIDAAHLMADALEAIGHDTRVAFDGPAALQAASAFKPDVALLDLGLPLMDGYELAQQLAARSAAGCPLLVAVTGYGQRSDVERTQAAGFQAHVVKPVDFLQLRALLDRLLTPSSSATPLPPRADRVPR